MGSSSRYSSSSSAEGTAETHPGAYSKWMYVKIVLSTASKVTIAMLRVIFATSGLPDQVVLDNDSGFTSTELKKFLSGNGIQQVLVSAYHLFFNESTERTVGTLRVKVTTQTTTGVSAAELLMGRRLRTHLHLLHPETAHRVADEVQKGVSDKSAKKFLIGDKLYAKEFSSSN
uniref:Integrase catalytic domain-containing protein n=1 Tax=Amphimedon queenslandica TaxID=400682 RepID=A0A1X7VTS0_AMPQE